ncbi:uncharacterized protein LOC125823539 [Solanum verrucosum]|uniref:uncharacterized protein LOC125823539 n=1 Tax=Solanum verrucosum TaxID=315347 RepID=UPI0020D006B8|nr:uncharacterized protein LOC125823539 [Solanum verrucosum]
MVVTTRGGNYSIEPSMPPGVKSAKEKEEDEVEVVEEPKDQDVKEAEVMQKIIPMPRPLPPFLQKALLQIPGYPKFMNDLVTKKRDVSFEGDDKLQHCSVIATKSVVQKKEDLGAFTIPCTIEFGLKIPLTDCNLATYGWSNREETDWGSSKCLVKVEAFIFPVDFVILDCEVDFEVPIILGRPFLDTRRALVDMKRGQMKF